MMCKLSHIYTCLWEENTIKTIVQMCVTLAAKEFMDIYVFTQACLPERASLKKTKNT